MAEYERVVPNVVVKLSETLEDSNRESLNLEVSFNLVAETIEAIVYTARLFVSLNKSEEDTFAIKLVLFPVIVFDPTHIFTLPVE